MSLGRAVRVVDDSEVLAKYLPPLLLRVSERIGLAATLELVKHYGGTWVFIPMPGRCTPDHVLARMLGFDKLLILAEMLGGDQVEVPKCEVAIRAARDRRIRALAGSKTQRETALLYGLTERQVRNIQAGCAVEERQPDLF